MDVPSIDYVTLFFVASSVAFFTRAAQLEHRSRVAWAALSLGAWIAFSQWVLGGIPGGLLSQALLFAVFTARELWRNRASPRGR
jgi:hypothetical protein